VLSPKGECSVYKVSVSGGCHLKLCRRELSKSHRRGETATERHIFDPSTEW
jgi:hypothetical protein